MFLFFEMYIKVIKIINNKKKAKTAFKIVTDNYIKQKT